MQFVKKLLMFLKDTVVSICMLYVLQEISDPNYWSAFVYFFCSSRSWVWFL